MRNVFLVARRDYLGYVTAWGFWLGLFLTPVLLGVFSLAPALAASTTPTRYYTVIESGTEFADALTEEFGRTRIAAARAQITALGMMGQDEAGMSARFDEAIAEGASPEAALKTAGVQNVAALPQAAYISVPPPAQTSDALRPWLMGERSIDTPDGPLPLFAAIIVPQDSQPIEYWSENITSGELKTVASRAARALAQARIFEARGIDPSILQTIAETTRPVEERRARATSGGDNRVTIADRAPYFAAIGMAFVLWTLIFSVVNYLLMGTIEERSNKIFDTLLTSVRLPQLLAGKLLAVLAVSLTLMTFWGVGGTLVSLWASSAVSGEAASTISAVVGAALKPAIVGPALLSFVLGYLMYGSIFLALGSLCDTIQEAQTLMTPLLVLLMSPLIMFMVAANDPTSPIVQVMSWVPLLTPFLLILRMPTEPALWEVVAQLAMMAAATALILWLAAKVYRAGAVHGTGVSDVANWFKRLLPGGKKPT